MPPWLQAVTTVTMVALALAAIVARWGGRAQRQDTDGRVLERAADATQRHDVTDATMAQAMATLARGFERMEAKIDRLAEGHAETREASVRHESERAADRERIARMEGELASLRGEIRRVDDQQTSARHALRNEIHSWITAGVDRLVTLLAEIAKRA